MKPELSDLLERFDLSDTDDLQLVSGILNAFAEDPVGCVVQGRQRLTELAEEQNKCPYCFAVLEEVANGEYECYSGCGYTKSYEVAV